LQASADGNVVKLSDFGVARACPESDPEADPTRICSKKTRCAPEVYNPDDGPVGTWSDIFAFGALMDFLKEHGCAQTGSQAFKDLQKWCWVTKANDRPDIDQVIAALRKIIK
jgi:serine/threonine protein kinase